WKEYLKKSEYNYLLAPVSSNDLSQPLRSERFSFQLPPMFSQKVKTISNKTMRTTLFRLLLSTYCILLRKYIRQDNITIWYSTNLRPSHLKPLFGYYVGIQPLTVDV